MKRSYIVFIWCLVATIGFSFSIVNSQDMSATPDQIPLDLPILDEPPAGVVAVITDSSNTSLNFKTFTISLTPATGDLRWQANWLSQIYGIPFAIPLLQDGLVYFVYLDNIDAYYLINDQAVIVLRNGQQITGSPLTEVSYSGEAIFGTMSLSSADVQTIKFSEAEIAKLLQADDKPPGWRPESTLMAEIKLLSEDTLSLQHIQIVKERHGCDTGWIPCKPFTTWESASALPIKYGQFDTEVSIADVATMNVTMPPDDSSAITLDLTMQSADKAVVELRNDPEFTVKAFLGIVDYGYVHIPFEKVDTITFTPNITEDE